MPYLVTKELSKKYKRRNKEFFAVDKVDFSIDRGEFVMIEGESGSGKTTFLNLIGGLSDPSSGQVLIEDEPLSGFDDAKISKLRSEDIKYIPQGDSLLSALTVRENILITYRLSGGSPEEGRLERIAHDLGISDLLDEYPSELSGGEMRRVAIARAVINKPVLIIADEPTGSLDDENTNKVMNIFKLIHEQGTALIVVTHQKETLSYATRTLKMTAGKLD